VSSAMKGRATSARACDLRRWAARTPQELHRRGLPDHGWAPCKGTDGRMTGMTHATSAPEAHDHPERIVPLQGASNFRDLGGYPGHAGRRTRWRRLYRSDHLGQLNAADEALLHRRGVTRALDFRGVHESAAAPYAVAGLTRHALPIEPTVAQRMQDVAALGRALDEATTVGLMEELYRNVVRHHSDRMAAFFGHVLAADQALVFHCTAGKDRTGIAAALLLSALGVHKDVVMQDFLLTNRFFRPPPPASHAIPAAARQALWSVRPSYLHAALHCIDSEHGGMPRYLRDRLGLTQPLLDELAHRCLEAA
jgi:protein-tyrosine phosphatase